MGQTRYPSKSWIFKSRFSFNARQHASLFPIQNMLSSPQTVGDASFSQPCLCRQLPLKSLPKIRSSTLVNFHLPIPPLFTKSSLQPPFNTSFCYTSGISHLPSIASSQPNILHQKHLHYLNHLANSGCLNGTGATDSREDWHCCNLSLVSQSMIVIIGLTTTNCLLYRLIKLVYCRYWRWFMTMVAIEIANDPIHLLLYPQPSVITSIPY